MSIFMDALHNLNNVYAKQSFARNIIEALGEVLVFQAEITFGENVFYVLIKNEKGYGLA